MALIVGWFNAPDVGSLVSIVNTRVLNQLLIGMSADIPIDELCRMFAVHENVFGDRDRLVLQRVAIGCKSPSAPCCPSCSFWFLPENIVDKVVAFLDEKAVHVKRHGYSPGSLIAI